MQKAIGKRTLLYNQQATATQNETYSQKSTPDFCKIVRKYTPNNSENTCDICKNFSRNLLKFTSNTLPEKNFCSKECVIKFFT
jgi:hypothetical protein